MSKNLTKESLKKFLNGKKFKTISIVAFVLLMVFCISIGFFDGMETQKKQNVEQHNENVVVEDF